MRPEVPFAIDTVWCGNRNDWLNVIHAVFVENAY